MSCLEETSSSKTSISSKFQSRRTFILGEEGLNASVRLDEDGMDLDRDPAGDEPASPVSALTADDPPSDVSFRDSAYVTGGESDEEEELCEILDNEEKKEAEQQHKKQVRKAQNASRMMGLLSSGGKPAPPPSVVEPQPSREEAPTPTAEEPVTGLDAHAGTTADDNGPSAPSG